MNYNFDDVPIDDLKKGYYYDSQTEQYHCLLCDAVYENGEIFKIGERYYEAFRAISHHLQEEHGGMFQHLIESDSKYNALTDKQKELFVLIQQGRTDQEIAALLGITASTVRHQKFSFREKAKQAKMYLAIYELALEKVPADKEIVPIHDGAKMVDDRYLTTKEESDKILSTVFESLSPLKLKLFSAKEKKKIVTLRRITEEFEKGKVYPEKEVNHILKNIFEDYPTLRRYLIEYGFMDRSKDCKEYWVK